MAYIISFHGEPSDTVYLPSVSLCFSLCSEGSPQRVAKMTTGSSSLNPVSLTTPVGREHFSLNNYNKSHREASACSGLCYVPTHGAGVEVRPAPLDHKD